MTTWWIAGTPLLFVVLAASAASLVDLHTPNGRLLAVNPAEVSSIREPADLTHTGRWAAGTHCVIVMTNGRFNAVAEDCLTVERAILGGPGR